MADSAFIERVSSLFPVIKGLAMLSQIGWETLILKKQVIEGIPRMNELLHNRTNETTGSVPINPSMHAQYIRAACSYCLFYLCGISYALTYWIIYGKRKARGKPVVPFLGTLILVICDMPVMVSEMYMLKSTGKISWDKDLYDLIFQLVYCGNSLVHIFMDLFLTNFDKSKDGFGTLITFCVSFLLMNCLYTPVMWALVGWYWVGIFDVENLSEVYIRGVARAVLNTLVLLGHFGQFITISIILLAIYCYITAILLAPSEEDKVNIFGPSKASDPDNRRRSEPVSAQRLSLFSIEEEKPERPDSSPFP